MKQRISDASGATDAKKWAIVIAAIIIFVVVASLLSLRPQRSVASYCKIYRAENALVASANGIVAATAHNYAIIYSKLERVAPLEIEPDIKELKIISEKIDKDPSQAFSASLSGLTAESNVKKWTQSHCQ